MYTPSQLEQIPIPFEHLMSDLEMNIMKDIIRRIKINNEITRSADWQIYRLVQMGLSTEYIQQQIQLALKKSDDEINMLYENAIQSGYTYDKRLYEATGKEFIQFRDNAPLQQLIQSAIAQTKSEMVNITRSLGFTMDIGGKRVFTPMSQYYQKVLDDAVMSVASGTFDYNSMIKKTVQEMTKSGIRTVDYASGWSNRVEVAARRAVMTGVNQVVSQINDTNAEKLGTDKFEVSWHASARPTHQVWHGRVFTRQQLIETCGLGEVTGLKGANCYHDYWPFIEGVSVRNYTDEQLDKMNADENKKKVYNGKEYTTYEAAQRQRQLEALMSKQRKDIKLLKDGEGSADDIQAAQIKYRATMAQYRRFSDAVKLPQQRERIYVDGLGRMA
jgi:Phage minor capsid protein 2.